MSDAEDAARYRWLKANHLQLGPDCWIRTGDDLDDAIDAEMRSAQQKKTAEFTAAMDSLGGSIHEYLNTPVSQKTRPPVTHKVLTWISFGGDTRKPEIRCSCGWGFEIPDGCTPEMLENAVALGQAHERAAGHEVQAGDSLGAAQK